MTVGLRVVLYTRPGCSLCDEAGALLDRLEVAYETAEDPRYAERVPVVEVDGRVVAELQISEGHLRRALKRAGRRGSSRSA